jgi:hypothetical protein
MLGGYLEDRTRRAFVGEGFNRSDIRQGKIREAFEIPPTDGSRIVCLLK